nr:hypothetical protein [Streptomyces phaeoluteigriseus]
MRTAYDDLIAPFERALMPLRRDGADALDPRAKVWKWDENLLVGTFDLWLCNDPDRPHTWLVVTVGLWTEPQLFDEEPVARLGHFDFTPHHPLLFLPRPPGPVTFTARVPSGPLPGRSSSRTKAPDAIGTAHQWTANDPDVLAERVTHDLKLLWPHLTRPERELTMASYAKDPRCAAMTEALVPLLRRNCPEGAGGYGGYYQVNLERLCGVGGGGGRACTHGSPLGSEGKVPLPVRLAPVACAVKKPVGPAAGPRRRRDLAMKCHAKCEFGLR